MWIARFVPSGRTRNPMANELKERLIGERDYAG